MQVSHTINRTSAGIAPASTRLSPTQKSGEKEEFRHYLVMAQKSDGNREKNGEIEYFGKAGKENEQDNSLIESKEPDTSDVAAFGEAVIDVKYLAEKNTNSSSGIPHGNRNSLEKLSPFQDHMQENFEINFPAQLMDVPVSTSEREAGKINSGPQKADPILIWAGQQNETENSQTRQGQSIANTNPLDATDEYLTPVAESLKVSEKDKSPMPGSNALSATRLSENISATADDTRGEVVKTENSLPLLGTAVQSSNTLSTKARYDGTHSITQPTTDQGIAPPNLASTNYEQVINSPRGTLKNSEFFLMSDQISVAVEVEEISLAATADSTLQAGLNRLSDGTIPRPEIARQVATQMAEALVRVQNNKVEIALNPEELGRVRMLLSTTESGISVSITTERPETLDLLRRHIDQLAQEFRELGYRGIDFKFSGGDTQSEFGHNGGESQPGKQGGPIAHLELPNREAMPTTRATLLRGLDLRL
jgi:flagellar hook-length control protein FliK